MQLVIFVKLRSMLCKFKNERKVYFVTTPFLAMLYVALFGYERLFCHSYISCFFRLLLPVAVKKRLVSSLSLLMHIPSSKIKSLGLFTREIFSEELVAVTKQAHRNYPVLLNSDVQLFPRLAILDALKTCVKSCRH